MATHPADDREPRPEYDPDEPSPVAPRGDSRMRYTTVLTTPGGTVSRVFAAILGGVSFAAIAAFFVLLPMLSADILSEWALAVATLPAGIFGMFVILRGIRPGKVVVGAEGLMMTRARRTRFLPYDRIDKLYLEDNKIYLHTGPIEAYIDGSPVGAERTDELFRRIQHAMRVHAGAAVDVAQLHLLERHGRSLAAWRAAAAGLFRAATTYRETRIGPADVVRVLADPTAAPEHRVGAALALTEQGGDGAGAARARVRVVAEACARDDLRVALEGIADGAADAEAIKRALDVRVM